jgi:predicted DNA-binding protein
MPRKGLDEAAEAAELLRHRPGTKRHTTKDRSWERRKRHDEKTMQVAFRDFPRALNERLKKIASREGKTVAQVAVPMIAYALAQIDNDRASLAEMEQLVQDAELG